MHHPLSTIHYSQFTIHNFLMSVLLLASVVVLMSVNTATAQQPAGETSRNAQKFYSIEGEVQKPGRFVPSNDLRIKGAIEAAGGLTQYADRQKSEIVRFNKRQKTYYTIYFQTASALSGNPTDNFILMDQDRVIIHSVREKPEQPREISKPESKVEPQKQKQEKVATAGEIAKPGTYDYKEGMTVSDLVIKSGGTKETSYPEQAEIVSTVSGANHQTVEERRTVNLKKALEDDQAHNLPLHPNDRLIVKSIPDVVKASPRVTLSGEINLPGQYPVARGERLLSVLKRAGGYMRDASPRSAVATKERVRRTQQTYLDAIAARIEREHPAEGKYKDAAHRLLQQIRASKASGRIKCAATSTDMLRSEVYDIEMEDGDTFYVPSLPDTVRVAGAVKKDGSYEHNGQSNYQDYIGAAGGYTATADEAAVFVVKADGSTQQVGKAFAEWSKKRKRLEIGGSKYTNQVIEPGDIIVVPELIVEPAWLRDSRDQVLKLLYNATVTPGELR